MTSERRRSTADPAGNGADRNGGWIHAQSSWRERWGLDGGDDERDSEIMREWFEAARPQVAGSRRSAASDAAPGSAPYTATRRPSSFGSRHWRHRRRRTTRACATGS
ncbi:hypothetical protein ACGFMO_32770 [Streptomyces niveus]|uniref:hypothetical protein n=1 Tax=Streptomyces niveus TaxID=193462 RepID=UPI003714EDE4